MRYLWCQTENYYTGNWKQTALKLIRRPLQNWDLKSNQHVDEFIGISDHVSNRIRCFYKRNAITIYPPVDTDFYQSCNEPRSTNTAITNGKKDFYLMVGALEPYKRVDLAVETFRHGNRPLKIVGKGTMIDSLKKTASPNIEFLGWKSDEEIRDLYRQARALIFPGEEDFGIVPLEAQACGCPVIAYGVGGALETIQENETGLFFREPCVESLMEALRIFETKTWDEQKLRIQAKRFSRTRFRQEMEHYLDGPYA